MEETTTIVTLHELPEFIRELLVSLPKQPSATVLALSGDLGVGKTTFVQTLARELGVVEVVTSPTFTIMKGYETTHSEWPVLLHMDAYRIEELNELKPLHFDQLLTQPKTLFCIEWAERIADALPKNIIWIELANTEQENKRTVRITRPTVNG